MPRYYQLLLFIFEQSQIDQSRTCEAAKWLCKDLYDGKIDTHRDRSHVIQENCLLYLYYTEAIFQQNYKKTIEAFIAINKIGDEALLQWVVQDGKLPNSYRTGKAYVVLLLCVPIRCKVTFFILIFNFFTTDKNVRQNLTFFALAINQGLLSELLFIT